MSIDSPMEAFQVIDRRHPACRMEQRRTCCYRQRGIALMIMLTLLTMWGLSLFVGQFSAAKLQTIRTQKTLNSLTQAKQALIAWSALQGDIGTSSNHRPGTLPCPDRNFFGSSNTGNAGGSCSSSGETSIGRLPWKTLGIEMLRDADGEPLWYAVSDNFRGPSMNDGAINSDSNGTLQLYDANGTTLLTPAGAELAAVIFAPGAALSGQDRISSPDAPESFLDNGNGRSNTSAAGPFIAGPANDTLGNVTVNDLVIGIRAEELIAALEKRALAEAQGALKQHRASTGKFPNPASPTGANCTTKITDVENPGTCASDSSTCYGRLPEDALSAYVAPWFLQNGWGRTIAYAVNKSDALDAGGADCSTDLNVGGGSKSYVIIAPGTHRPGQIRPSPTLSHYLDDPANADAWAADPGFVVPSPGSNDQLRNAP